MAKHAKTLEKLNAVKEILSAHHPMTLRQIHYQLVSRQVQENTLAAYKGLSGILADARKEGAIPWSWIEDRLRKPRHVSMWDDIPDFAISACLSYRRNVWAKQPRYVECWLEKDALSGIFEDVLDPYGVTLNVGRGYDGWDSIHNAAVRYNSHLDSVVLYFGDFDPSGEDMVRSLQDRLGELGSSPQIIKCALNFDDIAWYKLPPNLTKTSDTRRAAFVEKHGDVSVELDALPIDVLRERLTNEVEEHMDLDALKKVKRLEAKERKKIAELLKNA